MDTFTKAYFLFSEENEIESQDYDEVCKGSEILV